MCLFHSGSPTPRSCIRHAPRNGGDSAGRVPPIILMASAPADRLIADSLQHLVGAVRDMCHVVAVLGAVSPRVCNSPCQPKGGRGPIISPANRLSRRAKDFIRSAKIADGSETCLKSLTAGQDSLQQRASLEISSVSYWYVGRTRRQAWVRIAHDMHMAVDEAGQQRPCH